MTAEEMWEKSKLIGEYEAFSFYDDTLAYLIKDGIKTATSSGKIFYDLEGESLPEVGNYSIILDNMNQAVCIIKNTKVYIEKFKNITKEHAKKEGEGDKSLAYWQDVHKDFFTHELEAYSMEFSIEMELVIEEFEVVFK